MSEKLKWTTQLRKVNDLNDHPDNPRSLSAKSHKELMRSFDKFNYVELAAVDFDNTIVAGHQRIHIMIELGWGDREIEVRVPNRKLTDAEQRGYLLVSNKVTGDFDYDILANRFEVEELYEAGWTENELLGNIIEEEDQEEKAEDDELDEKEYDESITDNLDLQVRFVIVIPNEDSTSLHNKLDELLKGFPRAKMEKKV